MLEFALPHYSGDSYVKAAEIPTPITMEMTLEIKKPTRGTGATTGGNQAVDSSCQT